MKNNIIVSSCLLGNNCKYNGGNNKNLNVISLSDKYNLIEICPEVMGGLLTPRYPSEIVGDRVINTHGEDVTKEYTLGAQIALDVAKEFNCKYAILKSNSPSCGFGTIYDGTFSSTKIRGNGIAADLLFKNGIVVLNEDNFYINLKK